MLPSTCSLHFILGRPLFTFSIFFMYHCLYQNILLRSSQNMTIHLTPFALASLSTASFNSNMSISSTIFLLSTNFTPHIALTIALSALFEIATLFFLKKQVLLPYNIADLHSFCIVFLSSAKRIFFGTVSHHTL